MEYGLKNSLNSGLGFNIKSQNDPDDVLNFNDFDYSFGGLSNNKKQQNYPDYQSSPVLLNDDDAFNLDQWNLDQQNDTIANNLVGSSYRTPAYNNSVSNSRYIDRKKSHHGYSNSDVNSVSSINTPRSSHSSQRERESRALSYPQRSREDVGRDRSQNNGPPYENEGYRFTGQSYSTNNREHAGQYFNGRDDGGQQNGNSSYPTSPYSGVNVHSEQNSSSVDSYPYQEHQSHQPQYMHGGRQQSSQQITYSSSRPGSMGRQHQQQPNLISNVLSSNRNSGGYHHSMGTGGSNAQGRAINKMLLEILRERVVDPQRLDLVIETHTERMDCVNLATLLFHTGKKRLMLSPPCIKRIAARMNMLKEELRSREASNALYGLKCMCSEVPEVRQLVLALANKVANSSSEFVAQAVGNALYGCQMMTSDHEEVRYLLLVLSNKVTNCTEPLEAQNIGNALYGLRGMNSDHKEVRSIVSALTPKIATAREELNGQALGNSLYGLQSMSSREPEVRYLLAVLATKVTHTWEELKAQEVGNALYGLKRMSTDVPEVRILISALIAKISTSMEILDAQAIGNSFYGMQNMQSDNSVEVLTLLGVLADKVVTSCPELDGQAMGNSLYGLQGMRSQHPEVRAVVSALTDKLLSSCLDLNAQEMGNALYGLQNMDSRCVEVRRLVAALTQKVSSSQHELTSQEIGNAMFGLQGMSTTVAETRILVRQIAVKTLHSHAILDPQGVSNSLLGIQRMSSDSRDVRLMIKALSTKIEHSWKLLSAQHVSNSLYGMQCMCSSESEVQYLLKALLPKIISCRDEMTVKHLSFSLFGLRNCSSDHENVRSVLLALKEKLALCALPSTTSGGNGGGFWSLHAICMVMFGMQGMSSEVDEISQLLTVFANKLSITSDLVPILNAGQSPEGSALEGLPAVDGDLLSNGIFGMQRMSTQNKEVVQLLDMLVPLFLQVPKMSIRACANVLFGMNGCSCACEATRRILHTVSGSVQGVIASATRMGGVGTTEQFDDLLMLFQSMTLCLWFIPEKESLGESLRNQLDSQLSTLESLVDTHSPKLYVPRQQTVLEHRLCIELSDRLRNEPFQLQTGLLVHGFHVSTLVTMDPSIVPVQGLQTAAADMFNPRLVVEVRGSSFNCPSKTLFHDLRRQYLMEAHGFTAETLHYDVREAELMPDNSALSQCGLRYHPNLLNCLYAPSIDDIDVFTSQLNPHGKLTTTSPGQFLSSVQSTSVLSHDIGKRDDDDMYNDNAARSFQYQHYTFGFGSSPEQQMETSYLERELFDDDFQSRLMPYSSASTSFGVIRQPTQSQGRYEQEAASIAAAAKQKPVLPGHGHPVLGMMMTWLGPWPTVAFNAAPQLVGSVSRQFLTSLNEKAKVQQLQHGAGPSASYYSQQKSQQHQHGQSTQNPGPPRSNTSSPTINSSHARPFSQSEGRSGGAQYVDSVHGNLQILQSHSPHYTSSSLESASGLSWNSDGGRDERRPVSLAGTLSESLSLSSISLSGEVGAFRPLPATPNGQSHTSNIQQYGDFASSGHHSAPSSVRGQWMGQRDFVPADRDRDRTNVDRRERPATRELGRSTSLQSTHHSNHYAFLGGGGHHEQSPHPSLHRTTSDGFDRNYDHRDDFNLSMPLSMPFSAARLVGSGSSTASSELDSQDRPMMRELERSIYSASAPASVVTAPPPPPGLGTSLSLSVMSATFSPPSPASSISSSSSVTGSILEGWRKRSFL
jgi:hypothetical protein